MDREYHALPIRELGAGAGFRRPTQPQAARVTLESPALRGDDRPDARQPGHHPAAGAARRRQPVHDHARRAPAAGGRRARARARRASPRPTCWARRPMRVAIERGLRRDELTVADIMTPAEQVEVIALADVAGRARRPRARDAAPRRPPARAGGRSRGGRGEAPHERPLRRAMVRGIFSISQIARQLGVLLPQAGEVARTFAEIEAALGH